MGQAKQRKDSGEIDYWYHGTNEYFDTWGNPPIKSKYKPELLVHSFISLSKDQPLAKGAGNSTGGLCRSKLSHTAKVLDLTKRSDQSEEHWRLVVTSELGKSHELIQTYEGFIKACISGEVLRMHTSDRALAEHFQKTQETLQNSATPLKERAIAFQEAQNYTRNWIETVIHPAKCSGYDALICSEIDRYRDTGPKPCRNLHVFNSSMLSAPDWISIPDESTMVEALKELKSLKLAEH